MTAHLGEAVECEHLGCNRDGDWRIAGRHFCEEHANLLLGPRTVKCEHCGGTGRRALEEK